MKKDEHEGRKSEDREERTEIKRTGEAKERRPAASNARGLNPTQRAPRTRLTLKGGSPNMKIMKQY